MHHFVLFLVPVLIWGTTWFAINFQLGVVAPEVSVFYRHVIAALLLYLWALLRGMSLRFPWRSHRWFFLLGLTLCGFNYIFAYSAQEYIPSAMNAVLFATIVWINVFLARIFFGTPWEWHVLLGAALGMTGVVVLFWPELRDTSEQGTNLLGVAISLGGATVASMGNMVAHRAQIERLPVLQSNVWGMFYGALITGSWALITGKTFSFEFTREYVGSLFYLAAFGSVIAFGFYLRLLGAIGPTRAGYTSVVIPVVAVLVSLVLEGLKLNAYIVGGVVLVLGGNLVILAYRRFRLPKTTA